SPSDEEFVRFLMAMAALYPQPGTTKFRIPDPSPNELSDALWVQVSSFIILLGAELEEHGEIERGWSAVIASRNRPTGQADLFKIAHHESETGHHDDIWKVLLHPQPIAVLTPWNRGSKLPTREDCTRILQKTCHAYASSHGTTQR